MPTPSRIYTAALVVIGDEILSGRTHDKNIAQVATWLQIQGIRLKEVRVVADETDAIVEAVNTLRARNDYLFTTGGIGPTHDDITVDAISQALGVPVIVHPEARAILEDTTPPAAASPKRACAWPARPKARASSPTATPGPRVSARKTSSSWPASPASPRACSMR
nr:molybdopterin-binding protein [Novosphingobium sp. MBES04]